MVGAVKSVTAWVRAVEPRQRLHGLNATQTQLCPTSHKHKWSIQQIIEHLHMVGDYYGYKPGVGSLLAASSH
jgi:hypothetical protein